MCVCVNNLNEIHVPNHIQTTKQSLKPPTRIRVLLVSISTVARLHQLTIAGGPQHPCSGHLVSDGQATR